MEQEQALKWATEITGQPVDTMNCRWYGDLPVAIVLHYRTKQGNIRQEGLCKSAEDVRRITDKHGQPERYVVTEYSSIRYTVER